MRVSSRSRTRVLGIKRGGCFGWRGGGGEGEGLERKNEGRVGVGGEERESVSVEVVSFMDGGSSFVFVVIGGASKALCRERGS